MPRSVAITLKLNWRHAIRSAQLIQLISGTAIMLIISSMLPEFFNAIEKRKGIVLNDWVLSHLPSYNVSVPIFVIIWGMAIFTVIRSAVKPVIFIKYVWVLIFATVARIITISLIPLDPPTGLVSLSDPLTSVFYGHENITKDLFFSGHTVTVYLMYLCLEKKTDKIIALFATLMLVILLLVQHVHYTIDIIAAFIFVYPVYRVVNNVISKSN